MDDARTGLDEAAVLDGAAALIDDDTGPTFVLEGRIVTMSSRGVIDGKLAIRQGRIAAIVATGTDLPASLRTAPVIQTHGTIYPGLIDLHNHYVYNIAPLWRVPKLYLNRTQWGSVTSKNAGVSLPVRLLAGWPPTAKAIVRYVEAKALIGGTTTGQGIRTQVDGGVSLFRGAMRNVEAADDPRLPDSATLVPNLGRRDEDFAAFRSALDKRSANGGSYFYHLAEGTDPLARRTYTDLRDHDLLQPPLVGIHCLGLEPEDLVRMAASKSKVVWSPFSNQLLYGRTLHLRALLDSGLRFAIGSDWTPSGSRNLLEELKVARLAVRSQGVAITARRLVQAVTSDAAAATGWSSQLGVLRTNSMADVLVIAGTADDPYDHLIDATEPDVRLVTVQGVARYGDRDIMTALHADLTSPLEDWSVGGVDKAFQLASIASKLNDVTLAAAVTALSDAFGDLRAFLQVVEAGTSQLQALGVEPSEQFTLLLDNEATVDGDDAMFGDAGVLGGAGAAAFDPGATDWTDLPASLDLDGLAVGGANYWDRVADQHNVDPAVGAALRAAYPGT